MTTGVEGTVEQVRVLQRLADLVDEDPGADPTTYRRVWRRVPEEGQIPKEDGFVKDYLIVTFGTVVPKAGESSLESSALQPQAWTIIVECWSAYDPDPLAGKVRARLLGWAPDEDNCDEIILGGGGRFTRQDPSGRPTRWMTSVVAETSLNNSVVVP